MVSRAYLIAHSVTGLKTMQVDDLEQRIDKALADEREKLQPYPTHKPNCDLSLGEWVAGPAIGDTCTCGLDEARSE